MLGTAPSSVLFPHRIERAAAMRSLPLLLRLSPHRLVMVRRLRLRAFRGKGPIWAEFGFGLVRSDRRCCGMGACQEPSKQALTPLTKD